MTDGILVIDKPAGLTSADVVAQVKRARGAQRCGHTGTLDPMATGVLPIALGEGTKAAPYLLADDKAYQAEIELGVTTDSLDAEGTETGRRDPSAVTEAALRAALGAWIGLREQIPPMYSALKKDGKRLYQLARAGVEVDRPPRPIRILSCELLWFRAPRAGFTVHCGKGTYVRSLVRDVGEAVGCGATLTALRRTRAGRFTLADAVPLAEAGTAKLVSLVEALGDLPAVSVPSEQTADVRHGRPLHAPEGSPVGPLRLIGPSGNLLAVAERNGDGRYLRYLRVFAG